MADPFPTTQDLLSALHEGSADQLIGLVLSELIGQPLRSVGRTLDMIELGFGEDVLPRPLVYRGSDPDRAAEVARRNETPLPRVRLHVQCPFRLDSPSGPLLGGHDIYRDRRPPHERLDMESWSPSGKNAFDRLSARRVLLDPLEAGTMTVIGVHADRGGGFEISLVGGWSIHVGTASALIQEYWRLFYGDGLPTADHFVVFPDIA